MYGEVTSRNHQDYSWGHLVHNNTDYINVAAVCGFAIAEIIFFKNSSSFFLKLGKLCFVREAAQVAPASS